MPRCCQTQCRELEQPVSSQRPWYFPYKMMNTIIKDLICGWIQIPGNHLTSDSLAALSHPDLWPRTTSKGVGGCFSRCRRPTPCVRCAWLVSFAWWDWHVWHVWRWEPLFFSWVGGWKGRKQSKMSRFIFFRECELFFSEHHIYQISVVILRWFSVHAFVAISFVWKMSHLIRFEGFQPGSD